MERKSVAVLYCPEFMNAYFGLQSIFRVIQLVCKWHLFLLHQGRFLTSLVRAATTEDEGGGQHGGRHGQVGGGSVENCMQNNDSVVHVRRRTLAAEKLRRLTN